MLLKHVITCNYSGLPIGTLEYITTAGHTPYLSHWKEMVALHPVFSLSEAKLLAYSRSEYERLAKLDEPTEQEEKILQVCFLALLHTFGSIQQQAPALPPYHIVQSQMRRVFALAYWKHHLDSKRFSFPEIKINKVNRNHKFETIQYYLDACFALKEEYERGVKDAVEKEKAAAAERAMKLLRNSWIVPVSRKELWRWVRAHMPPRYEADAQGWMSTLFLGNDRTVLDFDADEVDLMQSIIEGECPTGTPILHAVRERCAAIKKVITDHKEAFDVDYEQIPDALPAAKEPAQKDFPTLAAFIKAKATWYLQQRKQEKRQQNEQ